MPINSVYWLLRTSCGRKRTAMASLVLRPAGWWCFTSRNCLRSCKHYTKTKCEYNRKKQRFHRTFFDARIGFYRVLFKVCGRIGFWMGLSFDILIDAKSIEKNEWMLLCWLTNLLCIWFNLFLSLLLLKNYWMSQVSNEHGSFWRGLNHGFRR